MEAVIGTTKELVYSGCEGLFASEGGIHLCGCWVVGICVVKCQVVEIGVRLIMDVEVQIGSTWKFLSASGWAAGCGLDLAYLYRRFR